jgi:hypothetical protein
MKRSEMLGRIYTVLYQETDIVEDTLADLTNILLDVIEQAGMVPPLHEVALIDTPEHLSLYAVREWEPEKSNGKAAH